jgi:hypothetical protein
MELNHERIKIAKQCKIIIVRVSYFFVLSPTDRYYLTFYVSVELKTVLSLSASATCILNNFRYNETKEMISIGFFYFKLQTL